VAADRSVQPPQVSVQIVNNSSVPVTASAPDIKVDLKRMVVGIVLEDAHNNGPISRATKR